MIARARRLARDRRGVTIVEMAFVLPSLVMVLLALFDFSYRMYAQAMLEGTMQRAARQATVGDKTSTEIDTYIRNQLGFFSRTRAADIEKRSYSDFGNAAKQTICKDGAVTGVPNGKVDETGEYALGVTGLGGSDDVIFYKVSVTFPRMFPLARFLGWSNDETITSKMVLRNQPYGTQAVLEC